MRAVADVQPAVVGLLALARLATVVRAQDDSGLGPLIPSFGCGLKDLQQRLDVVEAACCGRDDACNGVPDTCSVPCALVFTPFYSECGLMLGRLLDDDAAGSAEVDAFDALDDECSEAVDLGAALGMLRRFLEDDHDLLLPALDGFETYRHMDPQAVQSQNSAMSAALVGCVQGWTPGDDQGCGIPPAQSSCCTGTGTCGMRCPGTPSGPGDPCIPSMTVDQSDCPPPPPNPDLDEVTTCTRASGIRCSPRECAAACTAARGCVSFRYHKQDEIYSNGQQASQMCCGGMQAPPANDSPRSFCSFSHSCTTDQPPAAFPTVANGPCGPSTQWNFYMKRDAVGGDADGSSGGGKR